MRALEQSFPQKRVLITGATSGLGRALALEFGKRRWKVAVTGIDTAGIEATADAVRAAGGETLEMVLDVTRREDFEAAAQRVADAWQGLDVLVNNAGVSWGAPIDEFPEIGWDKVFDTNVKGVFFLTQRLLPLLEAAATAEDPSRVVNIGSVDGIRTPAFDTVSYGPSKAAVHALTRQLASKLVKRNIIVNAIAPGPFPTWMLSTGVGTGGDVEGTDWDAVGRMTPRGRVGGPADICGLTIYLCSRAGAYTVGEVITCDGGIVVS